MTDTTDKDVRIFPVETSFQKLARRPGGIPRDKALEQAQTKIKEMAPGFDDWLATTLQQLVDAVSRGRTGQAAANWIETANHFSRQLRDVGSTMDYGLVTFIADSLCEMLDAIEAGAELNMESIQCHVDALFLARQKSYRGLKPEQVPELTSGLRRVVEQISTAPK